MNGNQLKCPMCGAQFSSQEEMGSHAKQMHSGEDKQEEHSITCSKCGMKAKSSQDLVAHEQQHSATS